MKQRHAHHMQYHVAYHTDDCSLQTVVHTDLTAEANRNIDIDSQALQLRYFSLIEGILYWITLCLHLHNVKDLQMLSSNV